MLHTIVINSMFKYGPPAFSLCLISGLTYITVLVRANEGQSSWFCYLICLQLLVNWAQFLLNRSFVPLSNDNYPGYVHTNTHNWYKTDDYFKDRAAQAQQNRKHRYKDCLSCDLHVPFRSHHCPYCRRCIYILDHHCFFLGHCVGRKNQKFFLVFCFYAAVGCSIGVYHVFYTLNNYRVFWSKEVIFFFLPYSMVMTFIGKVNIVETLYVGCLNFGFGSFLMTWFLFFIGLVSIVRGSSNYESKTMTSTDEEKLSLLEKFEKVFGRFGYFHFIVPFLPINNNDAFCEPGYRRLLGPSYA